MQAQMRSLALPSRSASYIRTGGRCCGVGRGGGGEASALRSGTLHTFNNLPSVHVAPRRVDVWVPGECTVHGVGTFGYGCSSRFAARAACALQHQQAKSSIWGGGRVPSAGLHAAAKTPATSPARIDLRQPQHRGPRTLTEPDDMTAVARARAALDQGTPASGGPSSSCTTAKTFLTPGRWAEGGEGGSARPRSRLLRAPSGASPTEYGTLRVCTPLSPTHPKTHNTHT